MARKFKTSITIDELGSASSQAIAANVDGDSQNRINIDAGGKLTWGSGSATGDTTLYRSAADTLKTDDAFTAASLAVTGEFTLPTADGTANQILVTDGSGGVTWATNSGGGGGGGYVGQVTAWAGGGTGATVPTNNLVCDGAAVSRSTYSALFAVIGTKYGVGDGSTTFNLPTGTTGEFLTGIPAGQNSRAVAANTSNASASHTHTGTSGNNSANHTHSGTTGNQSANHAHNSNAGNQSANHSHAVNMGNPSANHRHSFSANTGNVSANHTHTYVPGNSGNKNTGNFSANHYHGVNGNTGNVSAWHTHATNVGNNSANHSHTITVATSTTNHTHTITTADESAAHTHTLTTGNESAVHSHSVGSLDVTFLIQHAA